MHLQESGEMYLETILVLTSQSPHVRAIDVGEYMGYSKPSVSRAMSLFRQNGYITMDIDGLITLTDSGMEIAAKMAEFPHCRLRGLMAIPPVSTYPGENRRYFAEIPGVL